MWCGRNGRREAANDAPVRTGALCLSLTENIKVCYCISANTRLVTQTWRLRSGRTKKVNEPPAFTQVSKGNSEEEVGGGTGGFFVTQADTE